MTLAYEHGTSLPGVGEGVGGGGGGEEERGQLTLQH